MPTASRLILTQGTTPATPLSGRSVLYCKDDGLFYHKSNDGVEHPVILQEEKVSYSFPSEVKPASNTEISILLPYSVTFVTDLVGSLYYATTAPTAQVVVTLKHNGIQFGTLTVNGTTPTWSATNTVMSAGDRVSFLFPTQDSTWAGVSITLRGIRS